MAAPWSTLPLRQSLACPLQPGLSPTCRPQTNLVPTSLWDPKISFSHSETSYSAEGWGALTSVSSDVVRIDTTDIVNKSGVVLHFRL
jgi:hypothetical protein